MNSCPYYYSQQPPERASCDPFGAFNIEVKCTACAELKPATNFTVGWYRDNESLTQEIVVNNLENSSRDSFGNPVHCIHSRLKIPGVFLNPQYGEYFCLIEEGADQSSLMPSRSIQLRSTSGRPCPSETLFVTDLYSCAAVDAPVASVSSTSVTDTINAPSSGKKDSQHGWYEALLKSLLFPELLAPEMYVTVIPTNCVVHYQP